MYCKDCGKEIDGDSNFCSFCGAKQSASFVPPHTGTPVQPKEPIAVNRPETQTVISKYDQTYKKETDATFIGVILFISWMIFIGANTKFEDKALFFAVWLCVLIMRIILTVWVVGIAKRQNRNTTSWGLLAFFFPSVTLIIIGQINKLRLIVTIDSSLPLKQQISTLIEKANEFSSSERYYECIEKA